MPENDGKLMQVMVKVINVNQPFEELFIVHVGVRLIKPFQRLCPMSIVIDIFLMLCFYRVLNMHLMDKRTPRIKQKC